MPFKTDPNVVGISDAATYLGVTKQRIHQLQAAGEFPEPDWALSSGDCWLITTLDEVGAERGWTPNKVRLRDALLERAEERAASGATGWASLRRPKKR